MNRGLWNSSSQLMLRAAIFAMLLGVFVFCQSPSGQRLFAQDSGDELVDTPDLSGGGSATASKRRLAHDRSARAALREGDRSADRARAVYEELLSR